MQNSELKTIKESLRNDGFTLLRGLIKSFVEFEALTQSWFDRFHKPAARLRASASSPDGFTSQLSVNGYLLGHAEGYYRPCLPPPDVCLFWCEQAPALSGGETTWMDAAMFLDELPVALRDRLSKEAVVYESMWERERWQAEFGVSDVVSLKRLLDSDSRCRYQLGEHENLHLFFEVSAVQAGADRVPRFLNDLLAHLPRVDHPRYSGNVYCKPSNRMHWSTGGEIDTKIVDLMIDAHDRVLRKHRWEDGDLLILDNHRFLHGREPMSPSDRRVIFSRFAYL